MAKRIVILGAGESGAGAAVLAKKQGFDTSFQTCPRLRTYTKTY